MEKLSDKLKKAMMKLFSLDLPKFSNIEIQRTVIENIIDFARTNYPKEFSALLSGQVKDKKLVIEGVIYQPYTGTKSSSWMRINVPMPSRIVGSVHSHPSSSVRPSDADLQFFRKNGVVNLIIGYPYRPNNIACYDYDGNRQPFYIDMKN
ncbi:MAG: Mov34/MPN/PAD-1 family protein [archaeon]